MNITPRFVELPPLLIAGMRELLTHDPDAIPALWQKFGPHINNITHQTNAVAYGLCVHSSENKSGELYYMAGCEVREFTDLPADLSPLIVPANRYAVFTHEAHVSEIRNTIDYIFDRWLPTSGVKHKCQLVHFFERYAEDFDPAKGIGGTEIWLPVES
ncbi:GyrI-like domain-containing protein [Cellvibrio sp.]|uniref:GyrI-like domain-containing protein n=1 Tax=Cellvibrio sp. TaxID=1965322 RepID=UPI0039648129